MTTEQKQRKDVYQIVTEHVISFLEQGIVPWRVSWVNNGIPRNVITRKPYRGANVSLLSVYGFDRNLFVSEQQLHNLGGTIKKDERYVLSTYWEWRDALDGSGEKRPMLRYEKVYNLSQCEGITASGIEDVVTPSKPLLECKNIVKGMLNAPRIEYTGRSADFVEADDLVIMPPSTDYTLPELFYFDLFRMLIHSTGNTLRLNRKELSDREPVFSLEALIADMGAHYLCFYAGVTGLLALPNTGHLYGWMERFTDDARLFVFATNQAQKAVDYILNGESSPTSDDKPQEEADIENKKQ